MAAKPVVLPETFDGKGSWDEWLVHYENVAAVNGWNAASKLLWLKVRLTDRAQKAFQRLPAETRQSYELSKKALEVEERFEPASKSELYIAELRVRQKRPSEAWADYAEDLRTLTDKAYPDLEDDDREQIALTQYLSQLSTPQVAFSAKQQRPQKLEDAVRVTLEMESYISQAPKTGCVAQVEPRDSLVATVQAKQDAILEALQQLSTQVVEQRGSSQMQRDRCHRIFCTP